MIITIFSLKVNGNSVSIGKNIHKHPKTWLHIGKSKTSRPVRVGNKSEEGGKRGKYMVPCHVLVEHSVCHEPISVFINLYTLLALCLLSTLLVLTLKMR